VSIFDKNNVGVFMKSIVEFFIEHTLFAVLFIALYAITAVFKIFFVLYRQFIHIATGKKYEVEFHTARS
jgi:hypothetical protein